MLRALFTTGHTGGQSGGRTSPSASVAPRYGTPTRANGSTTSPSAKNGGPAMPYRTPRSCARELAGVPRVEVVGLSKERVEETFWDTITQVRADLAGIQRK